MSVVARLRRFTAELSDLTAAYPSSREFEERTVHLIRLLSQLLRRPLHPAADADLPAADVTSVRRTAVDAIRRALDAFGITGEVPIERIGCVDLVPCGGDSGDEAVAVRVTSIVLPPLHEPSVASPSSSLSDDRRKQTNVSGPSPPAAASEVPRESAHDRLVADIARSVGDIKHAAGDFSRRLGEEDGVLDRNQALLQRTVDRTKGQSKALEAVMGVGGGAAGDHAPWFVRRVPGLSLVWASVVLPLWAVVRHALLVVAVLAATVATLSMMLMVPRAYVREVHVLGAPVEGAAAS